MPGYRKADAVQSPFAVFWRSGLRQIYIFNPCAPFDVLLWCRVIHSEVLIALQIKQTAYCHFGSRTTSSPYPKTPRTHIDAQTMKFITANITTLRHDLNKGSLANARWKANDRRLVSDLNAVPDNIRVRSQQRGGH